MKDYLSSTSLKSQAKGQLLGKYSVLTGTYALHAVCIAALSSAVSLFLRPSSVIGQILYLIALYLVSIFSGLFQYGETYIYLKTACNQRPVMYDLFYGFSAGSNRVAKVAAVLALIDWVASLPGMLLILVWQQLSDSYLLLPAVIAILAIAIIGVVLLLSFSQSYYLLLDFPEAAAGEVLRDSRRLMKGSKGRLFYIYLTFVPLFLIGLCTCGIGLLWLLPYLQGTKANFYLDLMRKK